MNYPRFICVVLSSLLFEAIDSMRVSQITSVALAAITLSMFELGFIGNVLAVATRTDPGEELASVSRDTEGFPLPDGATGRLGSMRFLAEGRLTLSSSCRPAGRLSPRKKIASLYGKLEQASGLARFMATEETSTLSLRLAMENCSPHLEKTERFAFGTLSAAWSSAKSNDPTLFERCASRAIAAPSRFWSGMERSSSGIWRLEESITRSVLIWGK